MRKTLLILAVCLLAGAASIYGRPATNVLQGRVVDSNDLPVAAALVFIQSADGSAPHAFRADSEGHFSRVLSRKGLYDVRAEANGLWSDWQHNVSAKAGVRSDIILKLVRTAPPAPHR